MTRSTKRTPRQLVLALLTGELEAAQRGIDRMKQWPEGHYMGGGKTAREWREEYERRAAEAQAAIEWAEGQSHG